MVMQCPLYHVKRLSQFIYSSSHVSASTSFFLFSEHSTSHFVDIFPDRGTLHLHQIYFRLLFCWLWWCCWEVQSFHFSFFNLKLWKEVQCFVCDVAERYLTFCFYRVSLRLSLPVEVSISFLSGVYNCSRKSILN